MKYIGIEVDFILIFFGGIFGEGILFMFWWIMSLIELL